MVKIRLKRQGNKHRPFYRVVVSKAEGGRDSKAIENLGTYDPIAKPAAIKIDEERALHWLSVGAQPSETVAYLLKKQGILAKYVESNPNAKARFKFLNKAIAVMSKESAVSVMEPKAQAAEKAPEPVATPVAEVIPEPVAVVAVETAAETTPETIETAEAPTE